MVEYEACILGLQAALDLKVRGIDVYGDSTLIICQIIGDWRTKDSKLILYHRRLSELVQQFRKITFTYLPRSDNRFADALATLAAMVQIPEGREVHPLEVGVRDEPAYCMVVEAEPDGKPWYHDVKTYMQSRTYPEGATEPDKKTIRRMSLQYYLDPAIQAVLRFSASQMCRHRGG